MPGITTLGGDYAIHLMYKPNGLDEGESTGKYTLACMPHVTDFRTQRFQPNYLRSPDTRAVTCPRCKETKIFKEVRKTERP